ncbi:5-methyltetrahydropteroyltriglutamate--homocysteine methyltransferase [Acidisarcina polymorpha]|uniref:5-methyltetrahydropteroyltriglutamate--homocysteine methyltransferase n=1 Tax=Acidisarcina polymorpha TaxID=2211140 RepID=A0A2Z5FTZ2_9BACT|nr:5-methyltetrahydropteroyltriglutamate--homocysteine S-methyltransferase [Acidisarcina polymorpha]AXC09977.1 5-methyltetrahydropteroyltriglutamate--homocysteine methyltransferase [Acidisarcina polymorpha]
MTSNTPLRTSSLGFPRMGGKRELKFALESFWKGKTTEAELLAMGKKLRQDHWLLQKEAGISVIPSNDFSFYDQVLDTLVMIGGTPERFGAPPNSLVQYFAMARNSEEQTAMEMTKWFDTNYHYLVPEWTSGLTFRANTSKLLSEVREARALGIETRPVLIGPVTLLLLGKAAPGVDITLLLPKLTEVYRQIIAELHAEGVTDIQMDEPMLVTDLGPSENQAFRSVYNQLNELPVKLMLTSFFGGLGDNLSLAVDLCTAGLHIDAVRAPEEVSAVIDSLGTDQTLSLGVVSGRNIWLTNFASTQPLIRLAVEALGPGRVIVSTSCSLLHTPHDLQTEKKLDPRIKSWLRFSGEKLFELVALASSDEEATKANAAAVADREVAESSRNTAVRKRLAALAAGDFTRVRPYGQRAELQNARLKLPLLPTTTIGSFPQTTDIRQQRAAFKHGHIGRQQYEDFLRKATEHCIREQERIGLDVLVHGEFERNDMVEYFAEYLDGFAFTENGWVQSYGSRCVKPPVIYGDVSRPKPITVEWSSYAQSLTKRPMKGMLTGPITILQWSFVRDDIPRKDTAWQIAIALRDEVGDLEVAGLPIIQVDEPALREGLPLRRSEWALYLEWAVEAFKLTTSGVTDAMQIHTHMCYCEFEDILPSIAALDADVISMESARSRMELLQAFRAHSYPNGIGPGVFDIHTPRVPSSEQMRELLGLALEVLRPEQIWVNPDCGLKTRDWTETTAALEHMCSAAAEARSAFNV